MQVMSKMIITIRTHGALMCNMVVGLIYAQEKDTLCVTICMLVAGKILNELAFCVIGYSVYQLVI